MLISAVNFGAPIVIRYPRGEAYAGLQEHRAPVEYGKSEWIYEESEIALVAVGSMVKTAEEVRNLLKAEGHSCSLINARFVKPIDEEMLKKAVLNHKLIVTMEENVASGGFGEKVRAFLDRELREKANVSSPAVKQISVTIPDAYVEHGNVDLLKKEMGMDAVGIVEKIKAGAEA